MRAFTMGAGFMQSQTGFNFSTLYIDSCSSVKRTEDILSRIFRGYNLEVVDTLGRNHTISISKVLLVLGDKLSMITDLLQNRLRRFEIPQIATLSSSHWFDDFKYQYPQLLRLTESNTKLVHVTLETCRELDVSAIVLLHSDTAYGNSAAAIFNKSAAAYGICLHSTFVLKQDKDVINEIGVHLATQKDLPQVFVLFAEDAIVRGLTNSIASKDLFWTTEGRILVTEANLLSMMNCEQTQKFLGSLRIVTNHKPTIKIPEWSVTDLYSQYRQQNGQCYTGESQKFSQTLNSTEFTLPKMTYLSWVALAKAISDRQNSRDFHMLFNNKTKLVQSLLRTNPTLFDQNTHRGNIFYSVQSLNKHNNDNYRYPQYTHVYRAHESSENFQLQKERNPIFYRHGIEDSGGLQSRCSIGFCPCVPVVTERMINYDHTHNYTHSVQFSGDYISMRNTRDGLIVFVCLLVAAICVAIFWIIRQKKKLKAGHTEPGGNQLIYEHRSASRTNLSPLCRGSVLKTFTMLISFSNGTGSFPLNE